MAKSCKARGRYREDKKIEIMTARLTIIIIWDVRGTRKGYFSSSFSRNNSGVLPMAIRPRMVLQVGQAAGSRVTISLPLNHVGLQNVSG